MTYNEIAAQALREAAEFYRIVGEQNPHVDENLREAASAFEAIARQLDLDPQATLPGADLIH